VDLQHVLAALRQRWYIPVIAVAMTLLLAAGWMAYQTPQYRATAQVFVSTSTAASEQSGGAYQSAMFAQNRVATYAQLVSSPQVLDSVAAELQLPGGARALAGTVTATNPPQTVLLEVTATNASPAQAAAVANSAATHLANTIQAIRRPAIRHSRR
jgi:non-specific protein-tyrosine kinase